MKKCNKCGMTKESSDFYRNRSRKDGCATSCKQCARLYARSAESKAVNKRYKTSLRGRVKYATLGREHHIKCRNQWRDYFIRKYGLVGHCEMCGVEKQWLSGGVRHSICFDHRFEGTEAISGLPSVWLGSHVCNERNIATWESCNFGMLCTTCNISMPTLNRIAWLRAVTEYVSQTEATICK